MKFSEFLEQGEELFSDDEQMVSIIRAANEELAKKPELLEQIKALERKQDLLYTMGAVAMAGEIAILTCETAQELKRLGFPVAMIAEITGLPLSEIERLG